MNKLDTERTQIIHLLAKALKKGWDVEKTGEKIIDQMYANDANGFINRTKENLKDKWDTVTSFKRAVKFDRLLNKGPSAEHLSPEEVTERVYAAAEQAGYIKRSA